jgi:hypothetical protein
MTRREVARRTAAGWKAGAPCSVVAVRWNTGSVTLYPHGLESFEVSLTEQEWATLVELPEVAA